jgi:virginiamycin B lyase
MQNRYQRLLLVGAILALAPVVGAANHARAQAITEFPIPTPSSSPLGITTGPDGALWFAESEGNNIGRITTAGAFIEFSIPTALSYPIGITTGPDGALWFTEQGGSKIGRITTGGVITEFPIPNSGDPDDITAAQTARCGLLKLSGTRLGASPPPV